MKTYICMIPCLAKDYRRMRGFYYRLFSCLDIEKIVFVGPKELEQEVRDDTGQKTFGENTIEFLFEDDLLPFDAVKRAFVAQLSEGCGVDVQSTGWYYQQFLKLAYAKMCGGEYYLCWDADTVPLRRIEMFSENGKPYLDVKTEFQERYFITIKRLFDFEKIIEKSFVAEHMLFNKNMVLEMLDEIERTPFEGTTFYEKILYAAGKDNISLGFSEFETYGTWAGMRHASAYLLRDWMSFRNTNFFVDISDVTEEDLAWLAKDYDAATFEKYQETDEELSMLFHNEHYREKLSPRQFYQVILESGFMGEYENGTIKDGEMNTPM